MSLIVLLGFRRPRDKSVESQIVPHHHAQLLSAASPPGILSNLIFLLLLVIAFGTPDFIESREPKLGEEYYVQWFVMTTIVLLLSSETLANWPS